jgi:hypothetical protein
VPLFFFCTTLILRFVLKDPSAHHFPVSFPASAARAARLVEQAVLCLLLDPVSCDEKAISCVSGNSSSFSALAIDVNDFLSDPAAG